MLRRYRVLLADMVITTFAGVTRGPDPDDLFAIHGIAGPDGPIVVLHVTGSTIKSGVCQFSCMVDWTTLAPLHAAIEEVVAGWTPEFRTAYAALVDQARANHRDQADDTGTTIKIIDQDEESE